MKTKPSPTPWRVGHEYDNRRDEIEDADGRCIAVVRTRRAPPGATARCQFTSDHEGGANATLMAAAPELLAALKELIDEIDCKNLASHFATDWQARAAIAKAKGEG